jgi:formylglycine-generating enzyme required for sulfatase activity
MRLGVGLVIGVAAIALSGCRHTPQPLGEALVVVQTDVEVPRRVNHLKVEVLGTSGAEVDQREIVTPSREDWPVSFSIVLPQGSAPTDVVVRLRAYPEGHTLSARDIQRFSLEKPRNVTVAPTIADACANAPELVLAVPLTLRRGTLPITTLLDTDQCKNDTKSGSAVARLVIADRGDYSIGITHGVPDSANGEPGSDTAISLRTDCVFPTTQLACSGPIGGDDHLSRIDRVSLDPGTYWVVTGGADPAPADLTLVASRLDVVVGAPPAPPPPPPADPIALEPEPGVTIDRLLVVHVTPGSRGKVDVILRGECFGTPADPARFATCIDTAGQQLTLVQDIPRPPLDRDLAAPAPWPGDVAVPCNGAPKDGEVCVPGGAFVLGDTLALQDLDRRSQPERMRVVEPFFLDGHELSVARYRDALAHGFAPPDGTPLVNPEPALTPQKSLGMCTFSTTPLGRESYPLTCTSWVTARALCNFLGGDLPSEDQWEYAATAVGRTDETPYPWGADLPTCDRTVYGRTGVAGSACLDRPIGPVAVDDAALAAGDVNPLGIVGLGGNVEELLATPFIRYSDPAWTKAGLRAALEEADAPMHAARGADWSVGGLFATASTRRSEPVIAAYDNVGFRCARSAK